MVYTQKDKLFLWTVQSVSVICSVNIKCLGKSEMIKTTDLKKPHSCDKTTRFV